MDTRAQRAPLISAAALIAYAARTHTIIYRLGLDTDTADAFGMRAFGILIGSGRSAARRFRTARRYAFGAVYGALVPGAASSPTSEDHRPGAGRCGSLRSRATVGRRPLRWLGAQKGSHGGQRIP